METLTKKVLVLFMVAILAMVGVAGTAFAYPTSDSRTDTIYVDGQSNRVGLTVDQVGSTIRVIVNPVNVVSNMDVNVRLFKNVNGTWKLIATEWAQPVTKGSGVITLVPFYNVTGGYNYKIRASYVNIYNSDYLYGSQDLEIYKY